MGVGLILGVEQKLWADYFLETLFAVDGKILTSREETHGKLFAPARRAKPMPRPESSAQNVLAKTTGDVKRLRMTERQDPEGGWQDSLGEQVASWGHQGSVCVKGRSMKMLLAYCCFWPVSEQSCLSEPCCVLFLATVYAVASSGLPEIRRLCEILDGIRSTPQESQGCFDLWCLRLGHVTTHHGIHRKTGNTSGLPGHLRRKEPVIGSKALMQPCMATCQNNCGRQRQKDICQGRR